MAISIAPFIIFAVRWSSGDWLPVQDQAVLALRLDDLFSADTPLVGAFSRYGWSHPGPLWFWVMAPFRAVLGTEGLVIGSILLAGGILTGTNVLLWRRLGSAVCVVSTVMTMLVCAGVGAFGVVTPWNPNLAWPLYWILLVLLSLFVLDGRSVDLAASVLLTAMLLQLHVGYAVLALGPLTCAVIVSGPRLWARRGSFLRELRTGWTAAFLGLAVVLWTAPVLEQLVHGRDGNLYRIGAWFLSGGSHDAGERVGVWRGLGFLGGGATLPPVGLGYSGESVESFSGWMIAGNPIRLLPLAALLVAGMIISVRRSARRTDLLGWFLLASLSSGAVAAALVVGDRWPYLFLWRFPLAWFVVGASVCLIAAELGERTRWLPSTKHAQNALLVVAAGSAVITATVLLQSPSGIVRNIELEARRLVDDVETAGRPDPAVVQPFGPVLDGIGDSLLMEASAADWPLFARPEMAFKYGQRRTEAPPSADTWLVTQGSAATTLALSVPGAEVVAFESPLTRTEERELVQAQLAVLRTLKVNDRLDLVDSLGSPLVAIALSNAGLTADQHLLDTTVRLNRKVESSGQSRLAVVNVGQAKIHDYDEAIAEIP